MFCLGFVTGDFDLVLYCLCCQFSVACGAKEYSDLLGGYLVLHCLQYLNLNRNPDILSANSKGKIDRGDSRKSTLSLGHYIRVPMSLTTHSERLQ